MKKINVNYVALFRKALQDIVNLEDLRFRDVAMYYSILQCWNKYRFPEMLSINRQELMSFSKIRSHNTYRASLHALQNAGLIKYYPSSDPSRGSNIFICIDQSVVGQKLTSQKLHDDMEVSSSLNNSKQEQTNQIPEKKEVFNFFISNSSTEKLAKQFFNHNDSVGWMSNNQPIIKWQPFALNYIQKNHERPLKHKPQVRKKKKSIDQYDSGNFKMGGNGK